MGKIVAIGGGENGHHNTDYETEFFDKEIIRLTNKKNPNFLFIGLANKYPDYYFEVMDGIYSRLYHCKTDYLKYEDIKVKEIAEQKIKSADIIYVGGGNTYKLMALLKRYGVDKMLLKAYSDDKVLCGVSAGAICWCTYGNSNSRKSSSNSTQLIRVSGLGLVDILFCPHYNKEPFRKSNLKDMMKRTYKIPAIALDNAALEIVNNQYRILKLQSGSAAYKCYWHNGEYIESSLTVDDFEDISKLYAK